MEPFLGEIRIFGFDYAPVGWAFCNGQLIQIRQNSALYAVIGIQFGGDGQNTFALPNLQGRVPLGAGNGTGLTPRKVGDSVGVDSVQLTYAQMPLHTHAVKVQNDRATQTSPQGAYLAQGGHGTGRDFTVWNSYTTGAPSNPMWNQAISMTGNGQAHENRQPVQVLNYCIAVSGIFPPRP